MEQLEAVFGCPLVESYGMTEASHQMASNPLAGPRKPGSVGLVIERKRTSGELDGLRWYCAACNHPVYEEFFVLDNIETQFGAVFDRYYRSLAHRTCGQCGHVNGAPARYSEAAT